MTKQSYGQLSVETTHIKQQKSKSLFEMRKKQLKKNYYDLRSKKVVNLIKNLDKKNFKKSTLGGCIFFKKEDNLCLKDEKI